MENSNQVITALESAMQAEKKASQFYKDAISKVSSEQGKNLLTQLADFEQNHYNKLDELKQSLLDKGEYIQYDGTKFQTYQQKPTSEVSGDIESNKNELADILGMAIEAEIKAYERYKKMAEETSDPRGKEMFQKFAEEETKHRRILSDEYYQMNNRGGMWFWGD